MALTAGHQVISLCVFSRSVAAQRGVRTDAVRNYVIPSAITFGAAITRALAPLSAAVKLSGAKAAKAGSRCQSINPELIRDKADGKSLGLENQP